LTISSIAQSSLKPFCVDSGTPSVDYGALSSRTLQILKFLSENPGMQNARFMAILLKQPYNSLQKTLSRLEKNDIVSKPLRGYYELNYGTWVKTHPTRESMGNCVDVLRVHRVGLWACVPGMRDKMGLVGSWCEVDLANGVKYYKGHGLVFSSAEVRAFSDSCYYQRSSKPLHLRNVALLYEDLVKTVEFYSHGLAVPESVVLHDFELGLDVPCDAKLFDGVSRVEIYPPAGSLGEKARIHVQIKKDIPLPFGLNVVRNLAKEWVGTIDLTVRVLLDAESKVRAGYGLKSRKEEEASVLDVVRRYLSEEDFVKLQLEKLHEDYETEGVTHL